MDNNFTQEASFIRAKKRVKAIKGFYVHLIVYIIINIVISGIIIFGLTKSSYSFKDSFIEKNNDIDVLNKLSNIFWIVYPIAMIVVLTMLYTCLVKLMK